MALAVQILVAVTMFSVGLEIGNSPLAIGRQQLPMLAAGVVVNVIIFPAWIWAITSLLDLPSATAIGFAVVAACPGGPIGVAFVRMAGSSLEFATILMVTLGVVSLATTPWTIALLADVDADLDLTRQTTGMLLTFQLAPLILGLSLGAAPLTGPRALKTASVAANILLVVVVAGLVAQQGSALATVSIDIHIIVVAALAAVILTSRFVTRGSSYAIATGLITSVRNMSVAIMLTTSLFAQSDVTATVLVWSFWMIVVPALAGLHLGRRPADTHQVLDGSARAP